LRGAQVAQEATARNALAISGPLGSTSATRLLRPIPMAFKPAAIVVI